MTKRKKFVLILIIVILLFIDIEYSSSDAFLWLVFSASFFALYLKKRELWALIPCGYAGYYSIAAVLYDYTHIYMGVLLIPMFFIVPGVVLAVFGMKNNFKGFFNAGIILLILGIFFTVWKIGMGLCASVLFAVGMWEIIRYFLVRAVHTRLALGSAFVFAALVITIELKIVFCMIIAVLIIMKLKELK